MRPQQTANAISNPEYLEQYLEDPIGGTGGI